jgi:hypothetical protein
MLMSMDAPNTISPAASSEEPGAESIAVKAAPDAKPLYPRTAPMPTQIGPDGIRFDFNRGCRVLLPVRTDGRWRVRLRDLDTGNTLFQSDNQGALVSSAKRWFVRFRIAVWSIDGPNTEPREVFSHDYDPSGRDVLIQFPVGTLGDTLAWFPYAARFAEAHPGSRIICALSGLIIPLLRNAYSNLRLVTHEEIAEAATSACIAPPRTFSRWTRPRCRHVFLCRMSQGRSQNHTFVSQRKARLRASIGTTRMVGGRSCAF